MCFTSKKLIFVIFGLILPFLVFVTSVKTECTEQNCPEGSCVNGENLQCECEPGYYRLNISDYKSKCYRNDCPEEAKMVLIATHASMIPTCICDTKKGYWGNDPLNCQFKDPPCPSGKLVRETGKCDCEPGFYYNDGSCIAQDSHSSSLVPDLHSTSLAPVNNTERDSDSGKTAIIAGSVGGVISVLIIIIIVICCTCYIQKKRRKQQSKESKMEEGVTSPLTGNNEGSEENQSSSTPVPNLSNSSSNDLASLISAASIETNADVQDAATSDGSVNNNSPKEIHVHNHFHGPVVSNCDVVQLGDNNTAKYKKVIMKDLRRTKAQVLQCQISKQMLMFKTLQHLMAQITQHQTAQSMISPPPVLPLPSKQIPKFKTKQLLMAQITQHQTAQAMISTASFLPIPSKQIPKFKTKQHLMAVSTTTVHKESMFTTIFMVPMCLNVM